MEESGLEKRVNEAGGETYYSNDIVTYSYFDFNEDTTPGVIDVHGEYPGPRGIRVGDSFKDVMSLFPQDKDWQVNNEGIFYEDKNSEAKGYVQTYEDGAKEITINGEERYPFLRIFFKEDLVTHYTFFVIDATH